MTQALPTGNLTVCSDGGSTMSMPPTIPEVRVEARVEAVEAETAVMVARRVINDKVNCIILFLFCRSEGNRIKREHYYY